MTRFDVMALILAALVVVSFSKSCSPPESDKINSASAAFEQRIEKESQDVAQ